MHGIHAPRALLLESPPLGSRTQDLRRVAVWKRGWLSIYLPKMVRWVDVWVNMSSVVRVSRPAKQVDRHRQICRQGRGREREKKKVEHARTGLVCDHAHVVTFCVS